MKNPVATFLSTAFWAVGTFCAYWETKVFVAVHRFSEVDVAPLGTCSNLEAVIFTLSLAWLPLLILHIVVHQYQRTGPDERPRFPGVIDDVEIPTGLKWVRALLFVALLLWPTFCHTFLTLRAFDHYGIIPSDVIKDKPVEEYAIQKAQLLVAPFSHPDKPEWNKSSTAWWVNVSRTEWRKLESPNPPSFERVAITALPLSPAIFALLCVGFVSSALVTTVNGFRRRRNPLTKGR